MTIELNLRAVPPTGGDLPRPWARLRQLLRAAAPAAAPGAWAECRIDEAARRAWRDPLQFRREQLPVGSRARRVLDEAARRAGWSADAEAGTGRGVAMAEVDGTWVAVVAVVGADRSVARLVAVVDTGPVLDFDQARQDTVHGLRAGLAAAGFSAEAAAFEVHWLVSDVPCTSRERASADAAAPALINAWQALQAQHARAGATAFTRG